MSPTARQATLPRPALNISWSGGLEAELRQGNRLKFDREAIRVGLYRPFTRELLYFDAHLHERRYRLAQVFPTAETGNLGFYVVGAGSDKPFAALMTDLIPDLAMWGSSSGQFFPRYTYKQAVTEDTLFADNGICQGV